MFHTVIHNILIVIYMWSFFICSGTFDVQTVEITPQNDVKEFTDITCHFALGSLIKGCIIVISVDVDDNKKKFNIDINQCEYTAAREDSTEGTISVILPRGEYTVVVYDDDDAMVDNPAYNTTLTIYASSVMQPSGMCFIKVISDSKLHHDLNIGCASQAYLSTGKGMLMFNAFRVLHFSAIHWFKTDQCVWLFHYNIVCESTKKTISLTKSIASWQIKAFVTPLVQVRATILW